MPLTDLYSIVELDQQPGQITGVVHINADHPVFAGHFPGAPVLPGVVQVEMVKAILSKALGHNRVLKEMSTCKFLEVLNPAETPEMTIYLQYKGEEALDVSASGAHGGKTFFKIRTTFR